MMITSYQRQDTTDLIRCFPADYPDALTTWADMEVQAWQARVAAQLRMTDPESMYFSPSDEGLCWV